jgi:hypothetical protein
MGIRAITADTSRRTGKSTERPYELLPAAQILERQNPAIDFVHFKGFDR